MIPHQTFKNRKEGRECYNSPDVDPQTLPATVFLRSEESLGVGKASNRVHYGALSRVCRMIKGGSVIPHKTFKNRKERTSVTILPMWTHKPFLQPSF